MGVCDWRFGGLVVLGEGAFDEIGGEELGHAFRQHDERAERFGRRAGLEVGGVARPSPVLPADGRPSRVPGLSRRV